MNALASGVFALTSGCSDAERSDDVSAGGAHEFRGGGCVNPTPTFDLDVTFDPATGERRVRYFWYGEFPASQCTI